MNMMKSFIKTNILLKMINSSLIILPTPLNISIMWNFGSLLGMMLMIQIISGLFLSMHYCPNIIMAFDSIIHIMQDVKYGWLIRNLHANGASMFFICIYMHISRGMYYSSFLLKKTWIMGVLIFLLSMGAAFMGYVLPWGQMSFWGATVITNLISAIPYMGEMIVKWLWGGFSINNATLNRFYSFHFIMPFIILMMVIIHLIFLHEMGSSNPLGMNSDIYKIPFHIYFTLKDILGFILTIIILMMLIMYNPYILSDPDNFNIANPMNTPIHIQPEWYFLFAYAILRSIPNKLGGVIALIMSILIMMIMPFYMNFSVKSMMFFPMTQICFWMFISSFIMLTWAGTKSIETPYVEISQLYAMFYFLYFFINNMSMNFTKFNIFY
uniref:Cytochrome b n=1 Tax=Dryinus sp. ZJUH_2016011 TaxID=2491175 RepID=A0A3S8V0L8_9HYME|nr:cytochrome b [Dryinus sp. ZJUH_2016011]